MRKFRITSTNKYYYIEIKDAWYYKWADYNYYGTLEDAQKAYDSLIIPRVKETKKKLIKESNWI